MAILSHVKNTYLLTMLSDGRKSAFFLLLLQIILLICYGFFARYGSKKDDHGVYYLFQDIHGMVFVGIGFLMTFLKRYGFSAVGFNFFLGAILVQWSILCRGFFHMNNLKILISIESMIEADIAAASVLISMGALLGKTTLIQLTVMGIIEIIVYECNSYLGYEILKVADAGASIFVHIFGAYFGLSASFVLNKINRKNGTESNESLENSSSTSNLFAMIGTIFLWLYWPSFNAAELTGDAQHRSIINTYLSIAASCVTAFTFSSMLTPDSKFDMVHIQNSTLAGGVAVGAVANMMIQPYGAIFIGMLAGSLSVIGYNIFTPWINRNLKFHDTCGIHNLHGLPGILSAIASAIMAVVATESQYQIGLYDVFPARAPVEPLFNTDAFRTFQGDGRTALQQAGYQLLALVITIVIAIVTGFITGVIMCSLCASLQNISPAAEYNDAVFWKLDEEEEAKEKTSSNNQRNRASNNVFPMEVVNNA